PPRPASKSFAVSESRSVGMPRDSPAARAAMTSRFSKQIDRTWAVSSSSMRSTMSSIVPSARRRSPSSELSSPSRSAYRAASDDGVIAGASIPGANSRPRLGLESVGSAIVRRRRLLPLAEEVLGEPIDRDLQWVAVLHRIGRAVTEHRCGQIPAGAGGQGREQVLFGEELEVVARACRAGLHEVFVVAVQPRALEDVEHIVDVEFGETVRQDGA